MGKPNLHTQCKNKLLPASGSSIAHSREDPRLLSTPESSGARLTPVIRAPFLEVSSAYQPSPAHGPVSMDPSPFLRGVDASKFSNWPKRTQVSPGSSSSSPSVPAAAYRPPANPPSC
ncbi:hypothetical protein LY76DRAFT_685935, partial [Colletotrichum caudatum]